MRKTARQTSLRTARPSARRSGRKSRTGGDGGARSSAQRKGRATGGKNQRRGQSDRGLVTKVSSSRRERTPRVPARLGALAWGAAKFGLFLGLAYGALYGAQETYEYATTSPRFELRALIYQGSPHLSDVDLRERLKLDPGTNILAVDPDELAKQVASHPWIASATVLRHLPDTLEVRVVERQPSALLLADHFYLVDVSGVPFKRAARGERGHLPIITGVSREDLADLGVPSTRVTQALELLTEYQRKKRPRLGEIHLDEDGGASLYTEVHGTRLWLGRADPHRALERYDALRAAIGSRAEGLELVHLDGEAAPDHPERVVARFVSAHDEAAILAGGLVAAPDADALEEDPGDAASASIAQPKRRIPRYH